MSVYSLSHHLALPDGFIAATAIVRNLELYTLNVKDYRYRFGRIYFNLITPIHRQMIKSLLRKAEFH